MSPTHLDKRTGYMRPHDPYCTAILEELTSDDRAAAAEMGYFGGQDLQVGQFRCRRVSG